MDYSDTLEKAIKIAVDAHAEQTDKCGLPYILHPLHVMDKVDTIKEKIVAVLHDVVEDSDITLTRLCAEEYEIPMDCIKAIELLTRKKEEDYDDYIAKICDNEIARRVKIQDVLHNLDPFRMANLLDGEKVNVEKYTRTLHMLIDAESSGRYNHGR